MPRSELLKRIESAVRSSDYGVTDGMLRLDFLSALNRALRLVGGLAVRSLDDETALFRALLRLEAEG